MIKSIVIRCPSCKKIPFIKVYFDGRQSYLKWFDGKMHETFCRGMVEIECFNCKTKIDIITELIKTLNKSLKNK